MLVKQGHLRNIFAASILILGLLVLAGCETFYNFGPYQLGVRSNGDLVVVSCEERSVSRIYVEERSGAERITIWKASGLRELQAGDMIVIGKDDQGFTTTQKSRPSLRPGMKYFIDMNRNSNEVASALFQLPDGGLPVGKWLDPRGRLSDRPCMGS
ncbi:MAG: hypothetical protein JST25_04080 [Actinobacteria bacterium]|nr:hypothetical protein [Actinomycetota bacterium]